MRGLKELLPLMVAVAIVAVLLLSWIRTGAEHLANKRAALLRQALLLQTLLWLLLLAGLLAAR